MDHSLPTIKNINCLLNVSKTRFEGLKILQVLLSKYAFTDEDFIENCANWIQNCCKTEKDCDLAFKTLRFIFKISVNYSELNKPVSCIVNSKFFDYFFKHGTESNFGWDCVKTCLQLYREPSGLLKENIEKCLAQQIEKNQKIFPTVSECFALLPCLGSGGSHGVFYQANWKNQFIKFIKLTQSILNDLFVDVEELHEYNTGDISYSKENSACSVDYLVLQLHNHCSVLNSMLLNSFPTPKSIPTDLVLQIVCRGLAVNPKTLGRNEKTSLNSLKKVLPELHCIFFRVLTSLIVACGSNLLPYSYLFCKLIKQALEWTQSHFSYGCEKPFGNLRMSVYESVYSWLIAMKSGGCLDSIASVIVSHLLSDIWYKQTDVLLKETATKQLSKMSTTKASYRRIDPAANSFLCFCALKTLQTLLKFSGVLLKPEDQKILQETVVNLITDIQNKIYPDVIVPFSVPKCRKQLYAVLLELVNQPCSRWPPPAHFAFRLLKKGTNDPCPEIAELCSSGISSIITIVHEQYSNEILHNSEVSCSEIGQTINVIINETELEIKGFENNIENSVTPPQEKEGLNNTQGKAQEMLVEKDSDLNVQLIETNTNLEKVNSEISVYSKEDCEIQFDESIRKTETCNSYAENLESEGEFIAKEINEEPTNKKMKMSDSRNKSESTATLLTPSTTPLPFKTSDESNILETQDQNTEGFSSSVQTLQSSPKKFKNQSSQIKHNDSRLLKDSYRHNSVSPELSNDESKILDMKKRYYLRSTNGKGSSEEPEELSKEGNNLTNDIKVTPLRHVNKGSPTGVVGSIRRPRTRALSKLEETFENESFISNKKEDQDDDENIIESFNDSFTE